MKTDKIDRAVFISNLIEKFGTQISAANIKQFATDHGMGFPHFVFKEPISERVGYGMYRILDTSSPMPKKVHVKQQAVLETAPAMAAQVVSIQSKRASNVTESFIPEKNPCYVPFGFFNDLKKIVKSKRFCPVYITGLSGNGKTFMVEQVCASINRECIRVNINKRTDESDLIGSYELIDGNTIRREGPVLTAMRRGAVLLLDETDYGTEELLCLNGILEGKAYFDKKTGEIIHPAAGFNVIATANTKGKGNDDGRFIGANVLNEAFLERFAFTVEQEYPEAKTEFEILTKSFNSFGLNEQDFATKLVAWAGVIRSSFDCGAVDEIISTRRLIHIVNAFDIFRNRKKAIELCLARFDNETKTSFLDLYTKIDTNADVVVAEMTAEEIQADDA